MDVAKLIPKGVFGLPLTLTANPISQKLPQVFLGEFEIRLGQLGKDRTVSFHALLTAGRPSMKTIRALVRYIRDLDSQPVVVCSPSLDFAMKETLAREGIPYLQDGRNAFLPFIGAVISATGFEISPRKLSAQAQRIFVNFLAGKWTHCNASCLAEYTGKSKASITKYLSELTAICPLIVEEDGKSRVLRNPGLAKVELLETFEPYLVDPVQRLHRLSLPIPPDILRQAGARLAGETALAYFSDLAHDPSKLIVAMDKGGIGKLKSQMGEAWIEMPWFESASLIIQEWIYPLDASSALTYSKEKLESIDPDSLYVAMSQVETDDVRLLDAIEQLKESICR